MQLSDVLLVNPRAQNRMLLSVVAACGAALCVCVVLFGFDDAEASGLKNVVEQAKKPPEEQEVVTRPAISPPPVRPRHREPRRIIEVVHYQEQPYWQPYPYVPVTSAAVAGASQSTGLGIDSWHAGFKSLYLQPTDGVLADLGGAGIEFGLSWSGMSAEAGVFWLKGKVQPDSPAFGGLVEPAEIAFDARIRSFVTQFLGVNGFVGFRFGHLTWNYANSVFATDDFGYGEEILSDALNNMAGYFGLGLRPFQMGAIDVGVDLGGGWRTYMDETSARFQNDLFENGWFLQASADFALRF